MYHINFLVSSIRKVFLDVNAEKKGHVYNSGAQAHEEQGTFYRSSLVVDEN